MLSRQHFDGNALNSLGRAKLDLILAAAPADRAGAASAISETGYELGGALGTAVLGSVAAAVFTGRTGEETLGGAVVRAGELPADAGAALVAGAREAFVVGLQGAAVLGAVVLALTGVRAWRLLGRADTEQAMPDREPAAV
jgi:DHA2 family multidrug resistance protein-like MFS transporter